MRSPNSHTVCNLYRLPLQSGSRPGSRSPLTQKLEHSEADEAHFQNKAREPCVWGSPGFPLKSSWGLTSNFQGSQRMVLYARTRRIRSEACIFASLSQPHPGSQRQRAVGIIVQFFPTRSICCNFLKRKRRWKPYQPHPSSLPASTPLSLSPAGAAVSPCAWPCRSDMRRWAEQSRAERCGWVAACPARFQREV